MRNHIVFACLFWLVPVLTRAQPGVYPKKLEASLEARRVMLPNGWSLTPAGRSLELGDLPLNIAVSASQKLMAVTNNGQGTQTIQLIDAKAEKVRHSIEIPKSFYGLKFSRDEKFLYASGGNDNQILKYAVADNKLTLADSLVLGKPWPEKISPVGLDIDDERGLLYVVTKEKVRCTSSTWPPKRLSTSTNSVTKATPAYSRPTAKHCTYRSGVAVASGCSTRKPAQ